jgi:hypothetical protein
MSKEKQAAHGRLIDRLTSQAEDVRRLTSGLDEGRLAQRTVPEKWSLKELVCHLARIQEIFEQRVNAMVSEEKPRIVSYDPEKDPEFASWVARPGSSTLDGFFDTRSHFTGLLEELTPAEWHRPGEHPDFPHYEVHFAVEYMAHHEAHHIYQMLLRRIPFGALPH